MQIVHPAAYHIIPSLLCKHGQTFPFFFFLLLVIKFKWLETLVWIFFILFIDLFCVWKLSLCRFPKIWKLQFTFIINLITITRTTEGEGSLLLCFIFLFQVPIFAGNTNSWKIGTTGIKLVDYLPFGVLSAFFITFSSVWSPFCHLSLLIVLFWFSLAL